MSKAGKDFAASVRLDVKQALNDARSFLSVLDPTTQKFGQLKKEIENAGRASRLISKNMNTKTAVQFAQNAREIRDETSRAADNAKRLSQGIAGAQRAGRTFADIVKRDMDRSIRSAQKALLDLKPGTQNFQKLKVLLDKAAQKTGKINENISPEKAALYARSVRQIKKEIDKVVSAQNNQGKSVQQVSGYMATVKQQIEQTVREARKMGTALDPATEEFEDMRRSLDLISEESEKVGKGMDPTNATVLLQRTRQVRNEIEEAAMESQRMGNSFRGQTLAAQNVLRIIQDMPYGIMGVANNVEGMADSWANAKRQGLSFKQFAVNLVTQLTTGPFAIAAIVSIVTALALSWDKVARQIDKAKVALGLMNEEVAKLNELIPKKRKSSLRTFFDSLDPKEALEVADRFERLRESTTKKLVQPRRFGVARWTEFKRGLNDVEQGWLNAAQSAKGAKDVFEEGREILWRIDREDLLDEWREAVYGSSGEDEDKMEDRAQKQADFLRKLKRLRIEAMGEGLSKETEMLQFEMETRIESIRTKYRELFDKELPQKYEDYLREIEKRSVAEAQIAQREALRSNQRELENTNAESQRLGSTAGVFEKRIQKSYDKQQQQLRENDDLLRKLKEQKNAGLISEERYNSKLQLLLAKRELITKKHAEKVKDIEEDKAEFLHQQRLQQIQSVRTTVSSISQAFGSVGNVLQNAYQSWAQTRKQQLKDMGMSEEKATEKVREEGERRFKVMKAVYIAQATANTIAAGVSAYYKGVEAGWGPQAIIQGTAMMISALATGYAQIQSLKRLQIGGGGSGKSAAKITGKYVQLNDRQRNERVGNFVDQQNADLANPNNSDDLKKTLREEGERNRAAMREARAIGDSEAAQVQQRGDDYTKKAVSG